MIAHIRLKESGWEENVKSRLQEHFVMNSNLFFESLLYY